MPPRTVISIGNFDGVHIGHAALIRAARAIADTHAARVVVLAFDPHPLTLLKPGAAPPRLMTFARRAEILMRLGADSVLNLEPTPALLGKSAEEFIKSKVEQHHPVAFVEGYDFHFGKGRAGNNKVLSDLGAVHGYETRIVAPIDVALSDHTMITASSSLARWLLLHARVRDAALVLGRPHELHGVVTRGDRRGRTIGFPTANLTTTDMLPADAVYAAHAILPDGRRFPAAVNIGARPTFQGVERRVEAHLLAAPRDAASPSIAGLSEYDWPLRLELLAFVRDQLKFASIDELTAQIRRDAERVREICNNPPPSPPAWEQPSAAGAM